MRTPSPAHRHVRGHAGVDPGGVRCLVSSCRRSPDSTIPVRRSGSYVGPALAKTEAVQAGFDEGVMLTVDGSLAEATTADVFLLRRGGEWVTQAPTRTSSRAARVAR